ncbi:MAG: hypothetical protein WDZ63_03545 [Burkholderiales bacterium]
MKVESAAGTIKVFRRQGGIFINGFAPIFVGAFRDTANGAELRGYFRLHLVATAIIAGLIGLSLYHLLGTLLMPEMAPGYPEGWKAQRIRFELQFIGFSALVLFFAWLAGKPLRERIVALIERSITPDPVMPGNETASRQRGKRKHR